MALHAFGRICACVLQLSEASVLEILCFLIRSHLSLQRQSSGGKHALCRISSSAIFLKETEALVQVKDNPLCS